MILLPTVTDAVSKHFDFIMLNNTTVKILKCLLLKKKVPHNFRKMDSLCYIVYHREKQGFKNRSTM